MRRKRYYIGCQLEFEKKVTNYFGTVSAISLVWADGQVGACAVFASKKKAEKYAGKGRIIIVEADL